MENEFILPASINVVYNKIRKNYQFRLIIYNAHLSRLLFGKKFRAKLIKRGNNFYLKKDGSGNLLSPRPKSQNLFMSIKKNIQKDLFPVLKNKSHTIKIKLELNPEEWGLTSLDRFLESKEERKLAEKLIELGYNVSPITYNDKDKLEKACADLLIVLKNRKVPIEITTIAPSENSKKGINAPHGHHWTRVSGRIFPLLLYSLGNKEKSFFIMNVKWDRYKHVNFFVNKLKKFNCFVIFTNFSDGWEIKVTSEINSKLKKAK